MRRQASATWTAEPARRLPVGAEVQPRGGVHFRAWAPACRELMIHIEDRPPAALLPAGRGYFAGFVPEAKAGDRYLFSMDDGPHLPDPVSRFQPDGPHGPSVIVDPTQFEWTDAAWTGVDRSTLVVYEIHIGTFTKDGTWLAAAQGLPALADLGVTCIEVMPVADFPGRFGWGYDGVNLFAPTRLYGTPDDMRSFVDTAHRLGLGVILDVVYNHFGPDGCYLGDYSRGYFGADSTEWGQSFNFDGADADPVREFVTSNARYWIDEFHLDGLRIDAAQSIRDKRTPHILAEVALAVRQAAPGRSTWIVAEDETQRHQVITGIENGGMDLDAIWNDDFHHSAIVAATGRREAYYADYTGAPQEFLSCAKHGFLYQGQWNERQGQRRGTPTLGVRPDAFVCFLQNHDQVANWSGGQRLHETTSLPKVRALTALLLLGPWTPMLFQGQEYAADSPFHYFADLPGPLAEAVRYGRREFLSQFHSAADADRVGAVEDPSDRGTFERSVLAPPSTARHAAMLALHTSLLQLRSSEIAFRAQHRLGLDGAVLGPNAFVLRFFAEPPGEPAADRLLVVNLGGQLDLPILAEPLLASPDRREWKVIWSSDDPLYGGPGLTPVIQPGCWCLQAESAAVLAPNGATRLR
jgi:maltooligosyltrehalose trehalohydrolase